MAEPIEQKVKAAAAAAGCPSGARRARSPLTTRPSIWRTRQPGPTLRQVADLAGVSTGTVSNVLNRPEMVTGKTRARVEKAVAEVGFVRQAGPSREAAHWRRSGHAA